MGQCLCKPAHIPAPAIKTKITSMEVREIIIKYFNTDANIFMADNEYGLYSLDDLKAFLKWDTTDEIKYVKEGFDCDDFADVLKGRERIWYDFSAHTFGSTFGIVWGDVRTETEPTKARYHAVNYFIDDQKQVHMIEPQNDKIFTWTPESKAFLIMG